MDKRISQVEFDEFDKLLGEIPNVTSGASSQPKSSKNQSSLNEELSINKIQQCGSHQEGPKLPDYQSLTSAFSELSFNGTSSPSPMPYGQYVNGIQEQQPCYRPSLGSSMGNNFMRVDPGFRFIPNAPNLRGVEYPMYTNQGQRYLQPPRLDHPNMKFSSVDEEQYYRRMHQQNHGMSTHLRGQHPYIANGIMTPHHLMNQNFHNADTNFGISNQEALWNNGNGVSRGRDLDRLRSHSFQGRVFQKSPGMDSRRNDFFRNVNHNERVLSSSSYKVSSNLCSDPKFNNLRPPPIPQNYSSIEEVVGRIYFLAKDQNGCRFLQRKFTEGTLKDVEMIFNEIIMHVVELMTDPFGNYLVQKLLEVCSEDQLMQILHSITRKPGDLIRISFDMHGTRAVQKIVETLKTPEQFSLFVSSLKPAIVILMKNINGNHVAQRCLQYFSPDYNEFIYEAAFGSCVELATDRHGCCVIQKCLSHCASDKRQRLICEIASNALILAQDQYGNYVVQFVLKTRVSWAIHNVLSHLEGNYVDLSMQKYSSNVIEKCLKHAKEEEQSCIIMELISDSRFDQILQDPYGNYVIQAALKRSKEALHGALVEAIRPYVPLLKTSPYGKKVLQAIA